MYHIFLVFKWHGVFRLLFTLYGNKAQGNIKCDIVIGHTMCSACDRAHGDGYTYLCRYGLIEILNTNYGFKNWL